MQILWDEWVIIILTILLAVTIICGISIVVNTLLCGISPMPTSGKIKAAILPLIRKYRPGNLVYDMGAGWGTLVFAISKTFSDAKVFGIERSSVPYLFSFVVHKIYRNKNIQFHHYNFFKTPLNDADVVVCYLCPSLMTQLKSKLERELKEGAVVISSTFAVPGWAPVETVQINDLYRSKVYVYRKENDMK